MGLDPRIGPHFLQAGVGFGGSCLPKDVRALIAKSQDLGYQPDLLSSVLQLNQRQAIKLVDLAEAKLGSLQAKRVAILGLAFKPGTDDIREAPAIVAIEELLKRGAILKAYDPVAKTNAEKIVGTRIAFADTAEEAIEESNAIFILTDWAEFKNPALYQGKIVFDGRRVLEPSAIQGLNYEGIAW
jgi:UDPglucose 6-dehydrogenase